MTESIAKKAEAKLNLGWLSPIDVVFAIALLSMAPMLYLQCNSLWERPHLQFFPMAWVAFVYFLYERMGLPQTAGSTVRQFAALGIFALSLAAAVEAVLISSPWLTYLAGIGVVTSWLLCRGGGLKWTSAMGLTSLLWITLPLPAGYDNKLIQYLQSQSSFAASSVLDSMGILHLREGNILQLASKRLFVDEACSGVDSLYALMAISLTIVLWLRQPVVVAACALLMVPVWASCSNIARLITIVLSFEWLGVDLASGTPHTILGLVVFAVAFGCDYAFIRFLSAAFEPPPKKASSRHRVVPAMVPSTPSVTGLLWGVPKKVGLAMSIFFCICFSGVGAYSTKALSRGTIFVYPEFTEDSLAQFRSSLDLPSKIGDWTFQNKELLERERDSVQGRFSHVWIYRSPSGAGTISLDFPFRGFHLLDECYEGAGWRAAGSHQVKELDSGSTNDTFKAMGPLQVHFLDLEKDNSEFTYVAFVQFRLDGTPVFSNAGIRGMERFERTIMEPITYQIQALVTSNQPVSSENREAILKNLLAAVEVARPAFVALEERK
jgi:exosortase